MVTAHFGRPPGLDRPERHQAQKWTLTTERDDQVESTRPKCASAWGRGGSSLPQLDRTAAPLFIGGDVKGFVSLSMSGANATSGSPD